jgi:thymidylate synthase ThyX
LGVPKSALDDASAIRLALDPGENRLMGESLNVTTLSKLSRALFHPSYTFRKKLSHTADSQDQRHRMTPGSRPVLSAHLTDRPDFITPELVRLDPASEKYYQEVMARSWERFGRLKRLGVPVEHAVYLLPNALSVRFTESADLLNLHHKHAMRLCYNAQEEIWRASLDEAKQVKEVNPLIGSYLLPPCTLRDMAGARPVCPEGERYCGVKVWRMDLSEYQRVI